MNSYLRNDVFVTCFVSLLSECSVSCLSRLLYLLLVIVDNLLSAAQSFPNLNNSGNPAGNNATPAQRQQQSLLSLSQTMALSLTNSSDSEGDFLDSCQAQVCWWTLD